MGGSLEVLDLSALGKLSESESLTLVAGLAPLKAGTLKDLTMPGLAPFKAFTSLLATMSSLQQLDLSKNMLGDEGALELAVVLGQLRGLRRLDLGGKNNIGGDGCRALAASFARLPALEELLLPNNHMGETGCDYLTKGLKDMTALQVLDLTGNHIVIQGPKAGTEALGAALGGLTAMHTLRLGNTNIVGTNLQRFMRGFLKTIPNAGAQLLRLSVQRNGFETDGCKELAKVLVSLPMLQELDVSDNDITPDGMRHLATALSGMPLQELNISENDLEKDGAVVLGSLIFMGGLPSLTTLNLTDNNIGDGAMDLAEKLPDTLCNLALACNKIRSKGAVALANALPSLTALKQLLLEENEISDEGVYALSDKLKGSTSLLCLNLIRNKMGDAGCSSLTTSVCKLPMMQKLLLGENCIGEVGCMALAAVLGSMTALKELDVGGNRIGKDACGVLSAIARKNRGLCMRLEDQDDEDDHGDDLEGEDGEFEDDGDMMMDGFWPPGMFVDDGEDGEDDDDEDNDDEDNDDDPFDGESDLDDDDDDDELGNDDEPGI